MRIKVSIKKGDLVQFRHPDVFSSNWWRYYPCQFIDCKECPGKCPESCGSPSKEGVFVFVNEGYHTHSLTSFGIDKNIYHVVLLNEEGRLVYGSLSELKEMIKIQKK